MGLCDRHVSIFPIRRGGGGGKGGGHCLADAVRKPQVPRPAKLSGLYSGGQTPFRRVSSLLMPSSLLPHSCLQALFRKGGGGAPDWCHHSFSPRLLITGVVVFLTGRPLTTARSIASLETPLPPLSLHAGKGGGSGGISGSSSTVLLYSQNPDTVNVSDDENGNDPGLGSGRGGGSAAGAETRLTESGRPKRSRAAMTRG